MIQLQFTVMLFLILNFNKENITEGAGSDIVNYRIPVTNDTTYKVFAEVCFQTIKPRVVEQFASISEPDVTTICWNV